VAFFYGKEKPMNALRRFHPIVIFAYFAAVIAMTMLSTNPLVLSISFFLALAVNATFQKPKAFLRGLGFFLILAAIIIFTNPLFSKSGSTFLFSIFGEDFMKEELLSGLSVALMLGAVFYWFAAYNQAMDSEKFLYLFGGILPTISLILSMGLKFIPSFQRQMNKVGDAQKGLGIYQKTSLWGKIRNRLRVSSALVSWSLENAIDTADAMKARGYGVKKRTAFSIFRFRNPDGWLLGIVMVLAGWLLTAHYLGLFEFSFYPILSPLNFETEGIAGYAAVLLLGGLPLIIEAEEVLKWHYLKSKI